MATITKEFTVDVPDTWWVNSWDNGDTQTYTYDGPDTLWVAVHLKDDFSIEEVSDSAITRDLPEQEEMYEIVELDADANPAVAATLWMSFNDWEYTYTTGTNHDDSTYEEIANPTIKDLYEVKWSIANGLELDPIYKQTETEAEKTAIERKAYIKKYDDAYDFDTDTQAAIDTALAAFDTYLTTMANCYPWRYITIDKAEIPRIPASLITVFNALPEVN